MYKKDDIDSAELVDRIISAVIAGFCGYLIGLLLLFLLSVFFVSVQWVKWAVALAFAVFGFVAPNRSRDLWDSIWASIMRFYGRLYGWRGDT